MENLHRSGFFLYSGCGYGVAVFNPSTNKEESAALFLKLGIIAVAKLSFGVLKKIFVKSA